MGRLLTCVLLAGACLCAVAAEDLPEWKVLEKQVTQKRSELKKMRTANPAHIWGEATQSVFLRKRMPQKGELKYYAKQVVDVRPFCVCEHAAFNDGGTKARHSKRREKRSLGPDSPGYDCLTSELCPAWKQWSEATKKVELTEAQNEKIDAVSDELEELEKRFKELLDERERERKEKQKERGK